MKRARRRVLCQRLLIPRDTCYVRFGPRVGSQGAVDKYQTVRGELMLIHLDGKGRVAGIELVDIAGKTSKPCQEATLSAAQLRRMRRDRSWRADTTTFMRGATRSGRRRGA